MKNLKTNNSYISHLCLQKVGHKLREEPNILATKTEVVDERKENNLLPFLINPFNKDLQQRVFVHHTDKLEFNKMNELCTSIFKEEMDFVDFSNDVLKHLYEGSLHPMIKSGEVFTVMFENMMFDDIPCRAIGIYKLENKSKFMRFDESESIDYNIFKGYKLDKLDKGVLILDLYSDSGFIVLSVDDKKVESEFWTKNFLDTDLVRNDVFYTKKHMEMVQGFANDVVAQLTDKLKQQEVIAEFKNYYRNNDIIDDESINEQVLEKFKLVDEFKEFKENFMEPVSNYIEPTFELDVSSYLSISKKIKSETALDTGHKISFSTNDCELLNETTERGFDEEKKMYFYKVYFNSEV